MDERCLFAIRTRSNQKVITSEGTLPHDFQAQHKSHIGKNMYIAMTGLRLNQNDITKGGQAYPVSLVRVGTMVKATKDSFKGVYKGDGGFHYPKIISNRVRVKGNLYFKACEITRSKEGAEKQPKMSPCLGSLVNNYT